MSVSLSSTIAASLAALTIATVMCSTPASAHFVSSSMHIIPFSGSHPGNLVNNVNNQPIIAKGFPTGPTTIQSPNHHWRHWGYGFGYGGAEMASSDDSCLEYRQIYDRSGHYLGRQQINVCQ
jgi:hypothetical protein